MSSVAALQALVEVGNDIVSIKCYAASVITLLFYDYLLTLPDEIQYVWKGRKPWLFYIFFVNRYLPALYEIWIAVTVWRPGYTHEMCNRTAWIEVAIFIFLTLIAQIFLTVRIYAITMKNKIITACFCGIAMLQLALGIYFIVFAAENPAAVMPPIPLDAFRLCVFPRDRPIEIAYTCFSLFFDFTAFSIILRFGFKAGLTANAVAASRPSIVHTIVQDATIYFFVIFTSHLIFLSTLIFERPSLQLLPAVGNDVFLPVMISRLMISLKKAASGDDGWTEISTAPRGEGLRFKRHEDSLRTRPLLGGDTAGNGFRAPRRRDFDSASGFISEEIGMVAAKSPGEPSASVTSPV